MPICDGATCNLEIPFRITKTALQMKAGNVPFSVDAVHQQLLAVLTAAHCWNISPKKRDVVFKNLCKACWDRQAAAWGDVATYTLARAKTTHEGIYMQTMRPDFENAGVVSKEAILSCVIHEMMHLWSYSSSGIQDFNRRANVDWDEMVADTLGYRVYARVYRGQQGFGRYLTPYNTYCVSFARARAGFLNVFGRLWREEADRNRLPPPIAKFITTQKAAAVAMPLVKDATANLLVKVLQECFFTWFFDGPGVGIENVGAAPTRINAFLESDNLQNMFAVTNAFQSYDGNNTPHAI